MTDRVLSWGGRIKFPNMEAHGCEICFADTFSRKNRDGLVFGICETAESKTFFAFMVIVADDSDTLHISINPLILFLSSAIGMLWMFSSSLYLLPTPTSWIKSIDISSLIRKSIKWSFRYRETSMLPSVVANTSQSRQ